MGMLDFIFVAFIVVIALISLGDGRPHKKLEDKPEDPNIKRLRQMADWDRFDDTKK